MKQFTHIFGEVILTSILTIFGITTLGHAETTAATRPNILIILADDLGYADTGFTGSKVVQTPNLDRLAANGVVLKNG